MLMHKHSWSEGRAGAESLQPQSLLHLGGLAGPLSTTSTICPPYIELKYHLPFLRHSYPAFRTEWPGLTVGVEKLGPC